MSIALKPHVGGIIPLIDRLFDLGYLPGRDAGDDVIRPAVADYQQQNGLEPDGWAGPITQRHLSLPRFCSVPERLETEPLASRWPTPAVTWGVTDTMTNVTAEQRLEAYRRAWAEIVRVCGVRPTYLSDYASAQIRMGAGRIDGPLGTLAWSELPGPSLEFVRQRYDDAETWHVTSTPASRTAIELWLVALHELLHALGIGHGPANNVMAPTYDRNVRTLQSWDVQQLQARYGPPVAVPTPLPPAGKRTLIEIEGKILSISGYRLTPLASSGEV